MIDFKQRIWRQNRVIHFLKNNKDEMDRLLTKHGQLLVGVGIDIPYVRTEVNKRCLRECLTHLTTL